jgi:4-diphosphocytidyl-2-C-methyl-D-erythritol kinase
MARFVEVEAPAKVNLRLAILAREESGYHGLESLFCAISLADTVRVEVTGAGVELVVEGEVDTGPPERNLVVRAARAYYQEIGGEPELELTLRKRIPSAAGLGGGSSDAAATLRALNELHRGAVPADRLLQIGAELGSDVPFFLCGSPFALGWSRGERLLALPPLPPRPVLVAHPGVPVPTGAAFAAVVEARGGSYSPTAHTLGPRALEGWSGVSGLALNDFEPFAVRSVPLIGQGLAVLREGGALIALLAGSGGSIFGVFPDGSRLDDCDERLRTLGFATWRAATLERFPGPPG